MQMMTFEEIPEKLDEVLKLNGILENIQVQAFVKPQRDIITLTYALQALNAKVVAIGKIDKRIKTLAKTVGKLRKEQKGILELLTEKPE